MVGVAPITNWKKPLKKVEVERYVLSAENPRILYIPPGYANGFMSLTDNTQLIFYSTSGIEDSKKDDIRYDSRYWDIWKIEER